ncbi:IS110 family transposase [Mycobacterium avium subsp. hominissuis]|uniref:IS110 family transposase n=1 Tax=Mycobacterium avium TaxID=1764 RepID=UPI001CE11B93|nr:IS110 family transposase [Mycobacterium avium]MCA4761697.1 IS110 family transposase [Mycobacterium avium subsp. hominissuis]
MPEDTTGIIYVGLDWAAAAHAVCVLSAVGKVLAQFMIDHTAEGIAMLIRRLAKYGDPTQIHIGIERPNGRLVDLLLEAGHPVIPVSPNAIKTWRDGEVISGAKSDAGDALVIAEYLRLRHHRLHPVAPYSAQTKALRTVVRTRDDIVAMRVSATNQLSALLDDHWPGAKAIFADIESPISLAFLRQYPTAGSTSRLGEKRLAAFLAKHGYSGRRPASELLGRLRATPAGTTDPTLSVAVADAVGALVTVLEALNSAAKTLDRSVIARLGKHPDAEIFTSLPRSGQINAAQVLAEWGDSRAAYDGPDAVAALAGATPVTKASGKQHAVHFRWACNKRFRRALTTFADNSRHQSPWAADIYARARARGHDHPHAVRILARAWIRVIYRCWHDHRPYDPNLHGGTQRLLPQTA